MKLICLLFLVSIVASCNKDPEYYTLETPADQMLLKASSTELTLEKEKENETAVTFTRNAAAQRGGADASIAFFFRMYMADLHSNVTSLYEIEAGERSISFTHNELNDILASWSILPGDKVTIEAEVIAQVNSSAQYLKPELSKTQFDVVGYDKNATAIYMVMITETSGMVFYFFIRTICSYTFFICSSQERCRMESLISRGVTVMCWQNSIKAGMLTGLSSAGTFSV